MHNNLGCLISLEGTEGAGKSTLAKFLYTYLKEKEIEVVLTREPGGTEIAEEIRSILLKHHNEVLLPKTEALLMFASRIQHIEQVVLPALKLGKWVISDRFTDASYAYQGAGRFLGFDCIHELKNWSIGDFQPSLTFLLDISLELGAKRLQEREHLDRIEHEKNDFFQRSRQMYLDLEKRFPHRFYKIDASLSAQEVQKLAVKKIDELIIKKKSEY
jgi:dTMP kinase